MAQRSRYEQKCKDCGLSEFVDDRAAGDLICQVPIASCKLVLLHLSRVSLNEQSNSRELQNCGLVAESHVIDESSEWRTFADSVGFLYKQQI